MKQPYNQYTPPPHPNWTGRAFRTSQEAYGNQIHFAETRNTTTRWEVAIYVVCVFALAVVAVVLMGES